MTPRCGFIAILGAANAGKSTFMNKAVGEKISIVTPKAHTTRNHIYGILCRGDTQLIFVDTPGLLERPSGMLQHYMRKSFWQATRESHVNLVFVDAQKPQTQLTEKLLEHLQQRPTPIFLVLNKVDGLKKEVLLPQAQRYNTLCPLKETFMISGRLGWNMEPLLDSMVEACPPSPWLFSQDDITQVSKNFMAAEITREKIFQCVHDEVPYGMHVETDVWFVPGKSTLNIQAPKSGISIFQTIFVEKESHRKLVIGHKGQRLKHIGQTAREELCRWLGKKVHLFLYVKIASAWDESRENYSNTEASLSFNPL